MSLHTHFREKGSWSLGKHSGSDPRGARAQGGEGKPGTGWHKAPLLEAGNLRAKGAPGQPSRCKGPPEEEAAWETVYAKRKEDLCQSEWGRVGRQDYGRERAV